MLIAGLILISVIILTIFLLRIKNTYVVATILTVTIFSTLVICFTKPTMHKQFSINIINYLINFNTDGSITTTKQITTTKMQEGNR